MLRRVNESARPSHARNLSARDEDIRLGLAVRPFGILLRFRMAPGRGSPVGRGRYSPAARRDNHENTHWDSMERLPQVGQHKGLIGRAYSSPLRGTMHA